MSQKSIMERHLLGDLSDDSLFEALMATAADGIIVIDRKGVVQAYNRACEKLFGYGPDEVVGQNVKMLMPSPYWDEHDGYLEKYAKTRDRRIIGIGREVAGRRKDSSVFPMYLSVGEGRMGGEEVYVGIIHDMTLQKAALADLSDREGRLSSILTASPEAIIMIDARGLIEVFSPAASRMFGYAEDEVTGQNVKVLMPQPYRDEHDAYIHRYLETGEKRIIGIGRVVVAQRKDGTTFPMELAVGEANLGERRMFAGFIRDISEQRGVERRLQDLQAQLLHVSRLSAMGQMASALAHELNQPLAAIANYSNAAVRTVRDIEEPKTLRARELMEKAAGQATRAGQIIRRLRAMIEKGETHRKPENLNKVVEEAMAISLLGSADMNIKIHVEFHNDLPLFALDRVQIQQVVHNLLRNSVEAMQSVTERKLTISTALDDAGSALVSIADTGPGIASEVADKLFKPFVTSKQSGMGIGLSLCRSIIETHGGRMWVEKNDAGGATFCFTIPASEAEEDVEA